jgi:hypothetical protein
MEVRVTRVRVIHLMSGLVFVGFAIQVIGSIMIDNTNSPRFQPTPLVLRLIGYAGITLSLLAPWFSMGSFILWLPVRRSRRDTHSFPLAGLVSVTALVAILEFFWTISGHPTWYMAFAP